MDGIGPVGREFVDDGAHLRVVVDDVGADALGDFDGDGGMAVETRIAVRVLEGPANVGDVRKRHDTVAGNLDRQGQNVFARFEKTGYLDREAALTRIDVARRDEAVVHLHDIDEFGLRDAVGFEFRRIDHDFEQFLAVADKLGLQHGGNRLDFVLQPAGRLVECPLRHFARQRDDQHRKERRVEFAHRRLVGLARQLGARHIDFLAHVLEGLVLVEVDVELQHDAGMAL